MKKVVVLMVAFGVIGVVACGGKKKAGGKTVEDAIKIVSDTAKTVGYEGMKDIVSSRTAKLYKDLEAIMPITGSDDPAAPVSRWFKKVKKYEIVSKTEKENGNVVVVTLKGDTGENITVSFFKDKDGWRLDFAPELKDLLDAFKALQQTQ